MDWKSLCKEVDEKGFDNASALARLVWACETGRGVDQHCSEDLKEIIELLNTLQTAKGKT